MPEEPESVGSPDNSWWTETASPPPAGVRVYPEGASTKPQHAPVLERTKPAAKAERKQSARPAPAPVAALAPASRPPSKRPPAAKPKRTTSKAPAAKSADLEETLSSLTAGLAALSQIMGGPKSSRR
nr:hypothetical protein [Deltaproteobacteria bacterium]